jgi:hypothetical protein
MQSDQWEKGRGGSDGRPDATKVDALRETGSLMAKRKSAPEEAPAVGPRVDPRNIPDSD